MSYRTAVTARDFHEKTRDYFASKRVLVLGGSGFIGSHVVEQLLAIGAKPVVITRVPQPKYLETPIRNGECEIHCGNLNDLDFVAKVLKTCPIVMYMAASVGGLEFNFKHPASIFHDNMTPFLGVIRLAQQSAVERFLVTSSACVYPRHCSIPTPEEEGVLDQPEPTNAGYGWAKRMEEFVGQAYAKEYGMSIAIARPYNAYGPRDNFDPEKSHVIPALIHRAMTTESDYFDVWGDGSHSRSFLYVDDFARGLIETTALYPEADPINIGTAEEIQISRVAELIGETVSKIRGRSIAPKFNPDGLTGQPRRMCDTKKAFEKIGFQAKTPFLDGISKTITWYSENANSTVHSN